MTRHLARAVPIGLLLGLGLAAPVLDGVIEGLTEILGVHIGEADARVNALRCGKARLV